MVARRAHNPKVSGSNPLPATSPETASPNPTWDSLYALGTAVRRLQHYDDALRLARASMQRLHANCLTLNARLHALGLETTFVLGDPTPPPILDELERRYGTLPLAFRAFYEVVGDIECVEPPPGLEPLTVAPAADVVDTRPHLMVGACYVELPDPRADAPLLFDGSPLYVDGRRLTFVRYLRHALQCGGFVTFLPGTLEPPTSLDLAQLTRELQPL